jgi:multidrug resistance protein, MATE family
MSTDRLSYAAHTRALLVLGLPIVGSQLSGLFLHMSDTVMLGWYGIDELAAVVIGGTVWFVLFITGSGFGSSLAGPIASAMAQGDETKVRRMVRMGIWLTLGYALLVTPVFFFAEPLLLMLGQKENVARLAGDYVEIVGFSIYPVLLTNLLRAYLAALHKTGVVLVASISAVVFHVGLNFIFIFGALGFPAMGVQGAAISSLFTDTALMLVLFVYALKAFPGHRLLQRFWRPDGEVLKMVFLLGMPVGLQMLAEVMMFASAAVMMGWVSAEMLAAHGIALQMAGVTFLIHLGVSQAATVRAGQAFGAQDRAGLRDGALTGVVLSLGFAVVTMAVFLLIPETLVRLFLDQSDPATPRVVEAGVTLVFMAAIFQIFDGGQAMAIGLLRGVHDTRIPMVIAIVCYWAIGIPTAYLLGRPEVFGGIGVWSGLVVGLATVWAALSWRFWRRDWVTPPPV